MHKGKLAAQDQSPGSNTKREIQHRILRIAVWNQQYFALSEKKANLISLLGTPENNQCRIQVSETSGGRVEKWQKWQCKGKKNIWKYVTPSERLEA